MAGARPRTLPAAVSPVLVGVAVAHAGGDVVVWRALLAFLVALAVQIGTNYANDYSDGVRGTDARRVGPTRLVAGGLAEPRSVKLAAAASFGVAALAGLVLAIALSPWLILVGTACILAGWLYTGGPRPYGYLGLGEVFVFVFFGLVAVAGTAYVSLGRLTALAFVAAVPIGLLATALLVANNLRDIETDSVSGKRTLAVRLGDGGTRVLYAGCVLGALALTFAVAASRPWALIALASAPLALRPVLEVKRGARGRDLVKVLAETGMAELCFAVLLAIGIAL